MNILNVAPPFINRFCQIVALAVIFDCCASAKRPGMLASSSSTPGITVVIFPTRVRSLHKELVFFVERAAIRTY